MSPARLVLVAAIVAGVSYIGAGFLDLSPGMATAWKGAGRKRPSAMPATMHRSTQTER